MLCCTGGIKVEFKQGMEFLNIFMEFQFCVYYSREIDYVWSTWVLSCLFDLMSVNAWNLWQTDAKENCFLLNFYDLEEPVWVKLKRLQVYVARGQCELFFLFCIMLCESKHILWPRVQRGKAKQRRRCTCWLESSTARQMSPDRNESHVALQQRALCHGLLWIQ